MAERTWAKQRWWLDLIAATMPVSPFLLDCLPGMFRRSSRILLFADNTCEAFSLQG
jgi:hypothetical protein